MNLFNTTLGILIAFFFYHSDIGNHYILHSNSNHEVIVATINGEPVFLSELSRQFNRNPIYDSGSSIREQLQDFLPAYVFYRLKLLEGIEAGFQSDEELLTEFRTFAREAAYGYWLDNTIKENIINTFKNRMAAERKAFHILTELPSNASAIETETAFRRMLEARDELLSGTDPEEVNLKFSSSRNGVPMGGSLPWITAGRTVQEFENALFDLEEGEISMPVRSQFGYHIIFLEKIRERSPERMVSHIFFQPVEDDSVKKRVDQAYRALADGEDWNSVAELYSMDSASATRGGNIGWVGYGMQFPEPFVDVVMQTRIGEPYSEPMEMEYGYHIIRIDSVRTFENDGQLNEYVLHQLERLQRLSPGHDEVYSHIRELGNLKIHENIRSKILSEPETGISFLMDYHDDVIITYFGEDIPVNRFIEFLEISNQTEKINETIFDEFITELVRESLIWATNQYFPEYQASMSEFLDGLIVFKVNEEFIWNPEKMDRVKLEQFYLENINRYQLDHNYTYYRFSSVSDSTITEAYEALNNGEIPENIENRFPGIQVLSNSTRNPNSTAYSILANLNPGDISKIESSGSLKYFYYLVEVEEPRSMTFDEAFYRVANDYQPIREEAYLKKLMDKYQVELYPENI